MGCNACGYREVWGTGVGNPSNAKVVTSNPCGIGWVSGNGGRVLSWLRMKSETVLADGDASPPFFALCL